MSTSEFVSQAYLISFKMRGLGYLLAQERIENFPKDFAETREGIGRLVADLGRELGAMAELVEERKGGRHGQR